MKREKKNRNCGFVSKEHYKQTVDLFNMDKNNITYGVHCSDPTFLIKYRAGNYFSPATMVELKTEEEIIEFVKPFGISREDCYCKDCGNFLLGKNVSIYYSNYRGKRSLFFTNRHCFLYFFTYNTDTIFRLSVCDNCLSKRFDSFNPNGRIQVYPDYAQYAFCVPDDIFNKFKSDSFGVNNIEHYIEKYGKIDGPKKYAEYVDSITLTKENQIKKYGEEEGTKRWDAYCKQQALTNTFEYKSQKYGMTKTEFKEYNKSRAVTKENLIKKHGEKEGIEMWEEYRKKQRYSVSLEYFIEKYGEEEGRRLYDNFNNSRDYYFGGRSKIGDEFCNKLAENFSSHEIYYGENEYDLITYDKDFCRPDYYDKTLNLVVEFYGDYFHTNRPEWPTKEEDDKVRIQKIIKTLGCKVIIVWENSYRQDPEELINSILFEINHLNEMEERSIKVF